ncbi:18390_t:CDS:2 [Gigaspora margarita]|uniref:18390_t:CDS:1 n=1 Tax=Gigaspora margarita TaxID=4874 RepID=A0ABN7VRD1_GIGMA|nr:18390_t:CDS:2 [Gigaspora margarita]
MDKYEREAMWDLNNSVQVEQNKHEFYGKFHTAEEILNNSHKRALNTTDENEQLHNRKKNVTIVNNYYNN